MKATFALLPEFAPSRRPFIVKKIARPNFSTDFHFHTECQLVYVLAGSGTRIIGRSVEQFEAGDLTFVGANVPHVWYSEPGGEGILPEAVSLALYIDPEAICEHLHALTDTMELRQFFKKSERGIRIHGQKKERIVAILNRMLNEENRHVGMLASFFQVLDHLLDPADLVWLNEPDPMSAYAHYTSGRVPKLMHYIQENFREDITLHHAASVAGLQVHSFCRFFKSLTNRTFSDFLNEVRIGFVCKLLQQSDLPVTQIALESGYTNISYFNRCFKKINRMSPKAYRNLTAGKS